MTANYPYLQVGRDGAMQLISEEMLQHYSWPKESFPTMMEERGFPQNKSDGLKDFHYRWIKLEIKTHTIWVFTGTTVSNCGTPCIVTLRGWSRLRTPQNRCERENFIINLWTKNFQQAIKEDKKLAGFHASLASPEEGNIPGFPQSPGNRWKS